MLGTTCSASVVNCTGAVFVDAAVTALYSYCVAAESPPNSAVKVFDCVSAVTSASTSIHSPSAVMNWNPRPSGCSSVSQRPERFANLAQALAANVSTTGRTSNEISSVSSPPASFCTKTSKLYEPAGRDAKNPVKSISGARVSVVTTDVTIPRPDSIVNVSSPALIRSILSESPASSRPASSCVRLTVVAGFFRSIYTTFGEVSPA